MNLNCPVNQTCDMNQHLHYGASFQQSQDGDGANTAFISNPRIHKQPDDFHMYNDSWLAELVICSTPASYPDKLAAVVPNVFCPNKLESFAQPDNVFSEQGNTSENEIFTLARNIFAGHSNYSVQPMQDYTIAQIPSSAVTTENQAAVVPSSDSNNIPMLTDVGFHDDNNFPAEDIGNGVSPIKNEMTYYQTPFASPKKVPIVPRGRKPRKPQPLEMFNGNGVPLLWQFILQLLISNTGDVCWTHKAPFQFKIVNPDNVAHLWGKAKGKTNMDYDKLRRSIRYYYRKNIISKKDRKQHVYRFVCDIVEILGYDPTVCPPKPGNSTASQNNTEETPKPCSTEMDETNIRSTQAPGQGIPCSFPKTEVGAEDLFSLDKANESEIGVNEILFPFEYPPIPDAFCPSDNDLDTQQQYDCQFPSFDAFSFEGFV